ncbi:MAG: S-ribosylhomocysteine lyase [Spirochaetales bacterium]|nr:S-ribosylhomocysteine lyase [Spirochaetales bacterium]
MKTIPSFTIDHNRLKRGVYVSRIDALGKERITTFDIRMKEPNREPVIDVPALHTIEHLGATFLRSHPAQADTIVYFGPMGCRTGFYLIVKHEVSSRDILPLVTELFAFIAGYEGPIPGASAAECGNWQNQDLPMAKWEADKFLSETIECITDEQLTYPR